MKYITRAQWGAREDGLEVYTTTWSKRTGHITHYSAANKYQKVRDIQAYHIGKGYGDIGYQWLVDYNGNIYEGRKYNWLSTGAHTINRNTTHIGTCFIGTNADVTDAAKQAIRTVYDEMNRLGGKTYEKAWHSKYWATSCPGDNLRNWVEEGMVVDMALTNDDVKKIWQISAASDIIPEPTVDETGMAWAGDPNNANSEYTPGTYLKKLLEELRKLNGRVIAIEEKLNDSADPVVYETVRKAIRDQLDDNSET